MRERVEARLGFLGGGVVCEWGGRGREGSKVGGVGFCFRREKAHAKISKP